MAFNENIYWGKFSFCLLQFNFWLEKSNHFFVQMCGGKKLNHKRVNKDVLFAFRYFFNFCALMHRSFNRSDLNISKVIEGEGTWY